MFCKLVCFKNKPIKTLKRTFAKTRHFSKTQCSIVLISGLNGLELTVIPNTHIYNKAEPTNI